MTSSRYAVLVVVALAAPLAAAQNVKITTLGSHTGELCDRDRGTLFIAEIVTPATAAHAVNELIKSAAVIASHVKEAVTSGGKVRPDSRTAAFMNQVKGRPVHPALSGTMEFDGDAKCVSGC